MIDLFRNSDFLFSAPFIIQILPFFLVSIKNEKKSLYWTNSLLIIGLIVGLVSTLVKLIYSSFDYRILYGWIRLDGLSIYFLFIVQLIAIPTTIYNLSYLKHYIEQRRSVKSFLIFYILLIISTQLLVITNQAILFLVCWELMSISAYLAMIMLREKIEVQKGSFYYFVASHVLVFILYVMFFLLHNQSGSWYFDEYHIKFSSNHIVPIIFILSLVGFGIKAGFMPFHFWLPKAHPIAPTVMSAFLSGVMIKMGVYGIIRVYLFIKPVEEWAGWLILIVSIISAIFGVWYALAQHDIKSLLAYHSIENIGIIGIGIGIGFIGSANKMSLIEALGFGGALLHTLNHAIFKSLLFIGSGVVYQNLGSRNIELMGGIVHKAKYIALFFLIGSVAISGIPPLNGFISEFIIYMGFFEIANELKNYYPIIILLFVVGLAFVGGLAVACFTKVNSIMFLGSERKEVKSFHTSIFDYIPLGFFSLLCIVIGFYPKPFIVIINNILNKDFFAGASSSTLLSFNWYVFTAIFSSVAIFIFFGYLIKLKIEKKFGRRIAPSWGCGYEEITTRMQYTASSFADELNTIPKSILVYSKKIEVSTDAYPKHSKFESHSKDFVDYKIVLPLFRILQNFIQKIEFLSHTDIRYYIAFLLIIITIYGLIAFLWI